MKCRVIYRPDETVAVVYPCENARKSDEVDADFYERIFLKAVVGSDLEGLPYDDMDVSELPDGNLFEKWRGRKGQGVRVDQSVKTKDEKINSIIDQLDRELIKPSPDVVYVAKLQMKLTKRAYD